MGYKVDYTSLDALFNNIKAQSDEWLRELSAVYDETAALTASRNMSGAGADSIRSYLETIHGMLFGVLTELIDTHSNSCFLYKRDYQTNIDTGLHAVIEQNELERIREQLMKNCERAVRINDEVVYALSSVSDIFSVSFRDVSGVDEAHRDEDSFISELDRRIVALESRHTATDFAETEALIESASGIIRELQGKGRAYKSNFSPADLASSAHYAALYEAHLALQAKKQDMAASMGEAIKNEEERIKLLEKEQAAREEKANIWRWVITGACVIGSIAAIALTGGAATPLVVGAISAVSGAVIAGTNNLADQYIATGDLSRSDWNSFGKDVVVGGVTGFVTGYAGAAVSGAITTGLSSTSVGSSLLNSSNAVTRIGTGAVIGSVSEVGSGVVSRGAGTFISSGGDLDAAMQDAFNPENIVNDAVRGAVTGGIRSAGSAPVGREMTVDEIKADAMETKPPHSPDPEKWINDRGGKIFVDGNGTWTYQTPDGKTVCYPDGYPDFQRAGLVEQKVDIGDFSNSRQSDFAKANSISPKNPTSTWHHSQDGHTLEEVPTEYHKIFTHKGGFSLANGG